MHTCTHTQKNYTYSKNMPVIFHYLSMLNILMYSTDLKFYSAALTKSFLPDSYLDCSTEDREILDNKGLFTKQLSEV